MERIRWTRVLLVALLLVAGCTREETDTLLPTTPAGYQSVSDAGYWFIIPQQWRVLEEDQRQPRFAVEVVGPDRTDGVAPSVGLILDEGTRWENLPALAAAFHEGPISETGATVVHDERVDGMGADAWLVETSYNEGQGDDAARLRQYDLLMVVDGLGVDLRVAAAAADFDEAQARTIAMSLRVPQTLEAAARD